MQGGIVEGEKRGDDEVGCGDEDGGEEEEGEEEVDVEPSKLRSGDAEGECHSCRACRSLFKVFLRPEA